MAFTIFGSWNEGGERPPEAWRLISHPLCSPTPGSPDRIDIPCRLEFGDFALAPGANAGPLLVMAYNLQRGLALDAQLRALRDGSLPAADVLLLTEADRGCGRTGYRNVAREIAQALRMNYVFGVEFVELPRRFGPGGRLDASCEHGNAILSRHPLGDASLQRFRANRSWYLSPADAAGGEPRLGGRMALYASIAASGTVWRAACFHLESGAGDRGLRSEQAREMVAGFGDWSGPALAGGDANVHGYGADLLLGLGLEPAAQAFGAARFEDAHAEVPLARRGTTNPPLLVIDLVLGRGVRFFGPGIGDLGRWGALSDHLPVWAHAEPSAGERQATSGDRVLALGPVAR